MRLTAVMVTGALLFSACAGGGDAATGFGPNLIVVNDTSGTIRLVDPDTGEDQAPLPRIGDHDGLRVQPTWSPDGRRLAWTELNDDGTGALAFSDGDSLETISTPVVSFYNQWDPTSTRVASLGNSGFGVALTVSELSARSVDQIHAAQPLFLSWDDEGERVALNTGAGLRILDLAGGELLRRASSPLFQAPIWIPGTSEILAVVDHLEGGLVVRIDVETGAQRELAVVTGPVTMALAGDGERLAFVHTAAEPQVVTASFVTAQTTVADGGLLVIELDSGEFTRLADDRRGALFWSPTDDRVLSLAVDPEDDALWFRWQVHDLGGALVGETGRVRASTLMNTSYLPFADQYAQSMTPWSPDGTSFLFAGRPRDGEPGIWLQDADAFGDARFLTDGDFAAWSPR